MLLAALMLPFAASCGDGADGWVVQVWQPSAGGEPEKLLAFGVVVEDGNHVLTVLDYEENIPDKLLVISPGYGSFDAVIQAADYRTSATLLQLEGANLPVAEIGTTPALGASQQALIYGWGGRDDEYMQTRIDVAFLEGIYPLFFTVNLQDGVLEEGKGTVSGSGAPIIDSNGKLIGILGKYWSKLSIIFGYPGMMPDAVGIDSAMELFTDSSYTSGTAYAILMSRKNGTVSIPGTGRSLPINAAEGFNNAVISLLDELGGPLPFTDLPELSRGFYLELEDGIMLVTAFTFPVELYSSDGSLLAQAKWVGVRWDRDEDKPNRLLYGSSTYIVEGAVSIDEDMGKLLQVIQPAINKLRR